jgi:hypothetical protein
VSTFAGEGHYSAIAIETGLALRLVFHQPLRQTEGMLRSIVDLLGVEIAVPDHSTLSRRGGGLTIVPTRVDRDEPLHLLVDSTGLKIYGEGGAGQGSARAASGMAAEGNGWIRSTASGRVADGANCTLALTPSRMKSWPQS